MAPEAALGGPIAALRERDIISIDLRARSVSVELDRATLEKRLSAWRPPTPRYAEGVFAKYAALVSSAPDGAVTRPAQKQNRL